VWHPLFQYEAILVATAPAAPTERDREPEINRRLLIPAGVAELDGDPNHPGRHVKRDFTISLCPPPVIVPCSVTSGTRSAAEATDTDRQRAESTTTFATVRTTRRAKSGDTGAIMSFLYANAPIHLLERRRAAASVYPSLRKLDPALVESIEHLHPRCSDSAYPAIGNRLSNPAGERAWLVTGRPREALNA